MSSKITLPRHFPAIEGVQMSELHGVIKPLETYKSDALLAHVFFDGIESTAVPLPVYRISPLGVELELPNTQEARSVAGRLRSGHSLNLRISIGSHISNFYGLTVATNHSEGGKSLIGIRWIDRPQNGNSQAERRSEKRWICGEDYLPIGIAPNPVLFNDFIYFKVLNFSKNGLNIITSLRNKLLIKGMILESTISFPSMGQIHLSLEIQNSRILHENGKEFLSLGAACISPDPRALELMGQYLLQFNPTTTVQTLREDGFQVHLASSALSYSFAKTDQDYLDVLSLRKLAYSGVGKIDQDLPIEKTGDIFDCRARILTVRHHGKLVGSMRIMFHAQDDQTEHEQFLKLPESFPEKHETAEVTRICTDPNYRGSDLFYSIIQQMVKVPAQANRRWILGSATRKLLPMYTKIGFIDTGVTYRHAELGNEEHILMLIDIPKLLCGHGVGPIIWNRLFSEMLIYLRGNHGFSITPLDQIRIAIYRGIGFFLKGSLLRLFS